jgi:hypothetical protein
MANRNEPPKVVRINSWGFESGRPSAARRVPLLGVFLIAFGLLLAAGQLFSAAQLGASALFLALGVVLVAAGLRNHSDFSLYAGVVVAALALSDVLTGTGLVHGPGWGMLLLGIAVAAIALIRAATRRRLGWSLLLGGLMVLWGGSEVAASNLNFAADRYLGPLLVVLLGAYLVSRSMRRPSN